MASEDKNSVTISKNNAGYPPYLDFDKLRTEGIAYLGQLAGQLWTDHNVHDPGITILEELCYALLDLGYRTNFPVEDILAKNPADSRPEDNFFSASQVLSCNPVTITDYRKLLIDIEGVRNAWLIPAEDVYNICGYETVPNQNDAFQNQLKKPKGTSTTGTCKEFLNGIYHVLVETEKDVDKDFQNDDPAQEDADKAAYIKQITDAVRTALMKHRNLCEDFQDIFILCKLETGICTSIEIKDGFDVETVYLSVANALHDFFSTVPQFYTLQQLLDKGKTMDEIYAGRPYSSQSHGFIDTEELESIALKKEIHTSDIYNALFQIEAVSKISGLRLMNCGKPCDPLVKDKNSYWRFHIPENYIPVFSMSCSAFEFTRNGKILQFDRSPFDAQLELGWLHNGKVLYPQSSPYLNAPVGPGVYRADLDNYYSIQNDFPAVYGIGEGDLPENVKPERQAQALQLKGYLFFFDQMLANYLSQLKNIRQLFSISHSTDIKEQHTYFLNTIATVPELNKLLRFGTGDGNSELGTTGTLLAFPISRADWLSTNIQLLSADNILTQFPAFTFDSLFALYESTDLLRNDLVNEGESSIVIYQTADGNYLYSIESSTDDFILLGRKICDTAAEAQRLAASVQYAGVFENNYNSFLSAGNRFTFNIELNIDAYTDYLGILVESDELYNNRRKDFLSHLLARFAESFTDFVLLNWNPPQQNDAIQVVENYLTAYPDLSRNRARAFNYLDEADKDRTVSGFEKKVKALAGIPVWNDQLLCPFTVALWDESYTIDFSTMGLTNFKVNEKFDLIEDALQAVSFIIAAMADPTKYSLQYIADRKAYQLLLDYGAANAAVYHAEFENSNTVEALAAYLVKSFSQQAPKNTVFESSWTWMAQIVDPNGNCIKISEEKWSSASDADAAAVKIAEKLNDKSHWSIQKEHPFNGKLFYDKTLKNNYHFVDITHFKIDINDTIIDKPGKFTYDLLDKGANSFKIIPLLEFDKSIQAENHCHRILLAASTIKTFSIRQISPHSFAIDIQLDGIVQAASAIHYHSVEEASLAIDRIIGAIQQHIYHLQILKTAKAWKFNYGLGYETEHTYIFTSNKEFNSVNAAQEAVQLFYKGLAQVSASLHTSGIVLSTEKGKITNGLSYHAPHAAIQQIFKQVQTAMEDQHKIARLRKASKPESLKSFVKVDGVDTFGTYVYRLIDKNRVPALYTESFPDNQTAGDNRKRIAALSKKAIANIPGICLGGDILSQEIDACNTIWYRYQLMLYNVQDVPRNQLVLFESAAVFASQDEALSDFNENYLKILLLASARKDFDKYISTTPILLSATDNKVKGDWIAFIPADTLQILQNSFGAVWIDKIIEIVKSYPIKIVDTNSIAFAQLFCTDYIPPAPGCAAGEKNWKYYFSIPVLDGKTTPQEWRSTTYYDTADAALADYRYFIRLLLFTGNYYSDCACTKSIIVENCAPQQFNEFSYKIFIHEVLAQSINWYENESLAWTGVEKFICAVQNEHAFGNFQRRKDCCYSYYVTCGNGLLEHPCKYDTETERNLAIQTLYSELTTYIAKKSFGYIETGGKWQLNDIEGNAVASLQIDSQNEKNHCEFFLLVTEALLGGNIEYLYEANGFLYGNIPQTSVSIQSVEQRLNLSKQAQDKWIKEWRTVLWYWACYFPISRTRIKSVNSANNQNSRIQYKYCIEIKLPSFSLCDDDAQPYQPCNSEPGAGTPPSCYLAWKSSCCYYTCEEALHLLTQAYELLQDWNHYYAVFDCSCNSYGIALNTLQPGYISMQNPVPVQSDIIAINPQCYETGNEVCAAVRTSNLLVNSEGMHVVEHILLRPIAQIDCECRNKLLNCNTWNNCDFPDYIEKQGEACNQQEKAICFQPGHDPYSFIATIVLPAWSNRFLTEQGKMLLEKLLFTEAPSHVLLRILWLKPQDFCVFETAFYQWKQSLAGNLTCDNYFNPCNFLELLCKMPYECLSACSDCLPCTEPGTETPPGCMEEENGLQKNNPGFETITDGPFEFLDQVNETFCFSDYCQENELSKPAAIIYASTTNQEDSKQVHLDLVTKNKPAGQIQPVAEPEKFTAKSDTHQPAVQKNLNPHIQLKAKTINARFKKYKTVTAGIIAHTAGNPYAIKSDRFLSASLVDADRFESLCMGILENQPPNKGIKKLSNTQQLHLLRSVISYYLDKISFNGKDLEAYNGLRKIVPSLKKAGLNMHAVWEYWNAEEVANIEPAVNKGFIRQLLTGGKNTK